MKSIIEPTETPTQYPILKILKEEYAPTGNTFVILFTAEGIGFIVQTNSSSHEIGYFFEAWDMTQFEDLQGKVILENE